jgi:hypothetical protein
MSLAFQDTNGLTLEAVRLDEVQPTYRVFRVKNTGSGSIENVKVRMLEVGHAVADASQLAQRAIIQMDYTRQSSGQAEQQFLGLGPISVMTEDPEELESVLMTGWLQLSADTFRWGSLLEIGLLEPEKYVDLYARYQKPIYSPLTAQMFQFSIRNIGSDTLQGVILTGQGSDTLSLDGIGFSSSVNLGNMAPATMKIVWLKTLSIAPRAVNGKIEVLSGTVSSGSIRFDVAGSRAYCSIHQIRSYLTTINIEVITTDEEILDLIYKSADEIDRATKRRFDLATVTELYDGAGQQKLVLDNYPIVAVHEVKIFNYNYQLIRDFTETGSDPVSSLILDTERGFITIPPAVYWLMPTYGAAYFYWPYSSYVGTLLRGSDYDYSSRFGRGVANIQVTYTHGFATPPPGIRDCCMKMVAIELLKKKGASDTQGASVISIAGMTESFAARGGTTQAGGGAAGPFGHIISELQADIDSTLDGFRKRRWGVV